MAKDKFARVEVFIERDSVTNELVVEIITYDTEDTADDDRDIHVLNGCSDMPDALETAADYIRGLSDGTIEFSDNELEN